MTEMYRIIRHGVAPLTAWLVATGRLPEYMQGDVTEFIVLGIGLAIPYGLSWAKDRAK